MLDRLCRMCLIHRQKLIGCTSASSIPLSVRWDDSRRLNTSIVQSYSMSTLLSKSCISRYQLHRPCGKHIRMMGSGKSGKEENADDFYSVSYIYVKTSTERWFEAPEGVVFDAGFVDSMPDSNDPKVPVVVGLPSSVGSHKDLMNVLLVFVKYGCRVIIPNMPSTRNCMCRSRSETTIFTNSPDEKAEFVRDFLNELDVKKVHMLVTDSDSVYTGILLCSQYSGLFKTFAMINPTGLQYTRFMQPVLLYRNINLIWDEIFHVQPVIWFILLVFKTFTSKRHLTVNEYITLAKTIRWLDFQQVEAEAEVLLHEGMPCMAVYREDCTALDQASTEKMLDLLGLPESSITVYDEQDQIVTRGTKNGQRWGVLFQGEVGDIKKTKLKMVRTKLLEFYKSSLNQLQ